MISSYVGPYARFRFHVICSTGLHQLPLLLGLRAIVSRCSAIPYSSSMFLYLYKVSPNQKPKNRDTFPMTNLRCTCSYKNLQQVLEVAPTCLQDGRIPFYLDIQRENAIDKINIGILQLMETIMIVFVFWSLHCFPQMKIRGTKIGRPRWPKWSLHRSHRGDMNRVRRSRWQCHHQLNGRWWSAESIDISGQSW
jgi:hypothetical protein